METLHFVGYVYIGDFLTVLVSFCCCMYILFGSIAAYAIGQTGYVHTYICTICSCICLACIHVIIDVSIVVVIVVAVVVVQATPC